MNNNILIYHIAATSEVALSSSAPRPGGEAAEPWGNCDYTSCDVSSMLLPIGRCVACRPGTATIWWADSECILKCPKGSFSVTGLVPCTNCPRNYYSDVDGARTCTSCPVDRPLTNFAGTTSRDECWFAHVEAEQVRAVGRKLAVTVFSVLRPDSLAQENDIVALFKDQPSTEAWRSGFEKQVAWSYTSFDPAFGTSDNSAGFPGMLPGVNRVPRWGHTFLFPSTGFGFWV